MTHKHIFGLVANQKAGLPSLGGHHGGPKNKNYSKTFKLSKNHRIRMLSYLIDHFMFQKKQTKKQGYHLWEDTTVGQKTKKYSKTSNRARIIESECYHI